MLALEEAPLSEIQLSDTPPGIATTITFSDPAFVDHIEEFTHLIVDAIRRERRHIALAVTPLASALQLMGGLGPPKRWAVFARARYFDQLTLRVRLELTLHHAFAIRLKAPA